MSKSCEDKRLEKIGEGLYWASIYWMEGANTQKGGERSEINSGVPHLGWGKCFVIDKDPTSKMVVLFCPHTYEGFQVTRQSFEYNSLEPVTREERGEDGKWTKVRQPFDWEWHKRNMYAKWEEGLRKSRQVDYDTAVVLFRMMGLEVPQGVPEGVTQKVSGGKEADALGLLKPVKRKARTGQILAFFWPETKTIREAMAEFGITRSNILSQLYLLQKNHGIGYTLKGDQAVITMPAGCEDPWAPEEEPKKKAA